MASLAPQSAARQRPTDPASLMWGCRGPVPRSPCGGAPGGTRCDPGLVRPAPDANCPSRLASLSQLLGPHIVGQAAAGCMSRSACCGVCWLQSRDAAMLLQILPAVVRFQPDLIFISAGFDAHRKDDLNYRYIGIAEKEYEWVTDQIVQVANRCGWC